MLYERKFIAFVYMPYPLLQLFSKKAKTKKPHTTPEERVQILLSLQNGHTTRQIAKSTNISPQQFLVLIKDEGKENISISSPTIRHILHANGLVSRIKRKKPYLSSKHQKRQLEFAKEHEHWTIKDWSKIIWSDESKFKVFGSDGKQYYWKHPEEPLNHFHIKPTVKFGGGSVMIWGCFTSRGVGGFCRIDGMMDAKLYQQILHEDLMNTIKDHGFNVKEIQRVWFEIDVETCTNLIHSMPEQIHDVIKA
ncbi:2852_t:CDS:2 [Entrophospora sp. SA101]|nr:2852_t:CDS:2 [Entrophospora sp. SA101]